MKTVLDFMTALNDYFDGLKNKTVSSLIMQELAYIKPSDLDKLFRQLIISQPASWKPDLKAIIESIKAAKIIPLQEPGQEEACPVCNEVNHSSGICRNCCYDPSRDGTPEQYQKWWTDWKAGIEPHYDIKDVLSGIERKIKIQV